MNVRSILTMLSMLAVPSLTYAGPVGILPEPGVVELLAIAAAAGVAIAIRKRRK
jgi:hypothetical protein